MNNTVYLVDRFGTKKWYVNGELHREDGPAYEDTNADKEWWLNGIKLTKQEFDTQMFIKWIRTGGELIYGKEIEPDKAVCCSSS